MFFQCGQTNNDKSTQDSRDCIDSRLSLKLEQINIQNFFNQHRLEITVNNTENVSPYRIFLHEFNASENQIEHIITILQLDSVTKKDYHEIHMDALVNADFQVHSSIGLEYIKNSEIFFYKEKVNDETAKKELKVSKVYLFYNKESKKACFQVYHGWG